MSKYNCTSPKRIDPHAPWTSTEALARIRFVLDECARDYHFIPSPVDWEAFNWLSAQFDNPAEFK